MVTDRDFFGHLLRRNAEKIASFVFTCDKFKVYQQVTMSHWENLYQDWLAMGDMVFEDLPIFD